MECAICEETAPLTQTFFLSTYNVTHDEMLCATCRDLANIKAAIARYNDQLAAPAPKVVITPTPLAAGQTITIKGHVITANRAGEIELGMFFFCDNKLEMHHRRATGKQYRFVVKADDEKYYAGFSTDL